MSGRLACAGQVSEGPGGALHRFRLPAAQMHENRSHRDGVLDPVPIDLRLSGVNTAITATDVVVHLAALAHSRQADVAELHRVNVELAERIGQAARANGNHMIFLSSVKVHGEETDKPLKEDSPIAPRDPYAQSKARAEAALRALPGLNLTVVRSPLVYGPGAKANFFALMHALARGMPLPFARVANRRSFIYVGNLAHAIMLCITNQNRTSPTYLVSDGPAISTPALCNALGAALGRPARLFPFPASLLELVWGAKRFTRSLKVDDSVIRRELAWEPPYSFEQGLRATADWYRSR